MYARTREVTGQVTGYSRKKNQEKYNHGGTETRRLHGENLLGKKQRQLQKQKPRRQDGELSNLKPKATAATNQKTTAEKKPEEDEGKARAFQANVEKHAGRNASFDFTVASGLLPVASIRCTDAPVYRCPGKLHFKHLILKLAVLCLNKHKLHRPGLRLGG